MKGSDDGDLGLGRVQGGMGTGPADRWSEFGPWEGGPGSCSLEPPVPKIFQRHQVLRAGSDGGVLGLAEVQGGRRTELSDSDSDQGPRGGAPGAGAVTPERSVS